MCAAEHTGNCCARSHSVACHIQQNVPCRRRMLSREHSEVGFSVPKLNPKAELAVAIWSHPVTQYKRVAGYPRPAATPESVLGVCYPLSVAPCTSMQRSAARAARARSRYVGCAAHQLASRRLHTCNMQGAACNTQHVSHGMQPWHGSTVHGADTAEASPLIAGAERGWGIAPAGGTSRIVCSRCDGRAESHSSTAACTSTYTSLHSAACSMHKANGDPAKLYTTMSIMHRNHHQYGRRRCTFVRPVVLQFCNATQDVASAAHLLTFAEQRIDATH